MVINSPDAVAVYLPKPSVARLKITPHITDVHKPQRMMNNTLAGTSASMKQLWERSGTVRLILLASGMKIATKRNRSATHEVTVSCVRDETFPLMNALTKRPTSIKSQ